VLLFTVVPEEVSQWAGFLVCPKRPMPIGFHMSALVGPFLKDCHNVAIAWIVVSSEVWHG
jgi:hypothetical protein